MTKKDKGTFISKVLNDAIKNSRGMLCLFCGTHKLVLKEKYVQNYVCDKCRNSIKKEWQEQKLIKQGIFFEDYYNAAVIAQKLQKS